MTMKWFVYEILKNGKQSNLYNEHLIEKQLDNCKRKDLINGILEYISSKNN